MKDRELLSLKTDETSLCIVEDGMYIGSPDDDSEEPDTCIEWINGRLHIGRWPLSEAQVLILKMYLNKEF